MNYVSDCCNKPTETIRRTPKDPEYQRVVEIAVICNHCRKDCEEISACDWCGEPGDLKKVGFDHLCKTCKDEFIQLNPGVAL